MNDIYLLGIGHNSYAYIDLAEQCGYRVRGLYHYKPITLPMTDHGIPFIGCFDDLWSTKNLNGMRFALTMGDNDIRSELYVHIREKGGEIPTLIHPKCDISRFASIGEGNALFSGVVVQNDATIGDNCVIKQNSIICHHAQVGNHCFIAGLSTVGARLTLEDYVFMGLGTTLISTKATPIGRHALIGAGAVVTKSVTANAVMVGNPARPLLK